MNTVLAGAGSPINIGAYTTEKKFPNNKFFISVHQAHGGYIVEINARGEQNNELYIVTEEQDLGNEIGKIITHQLLTNKHE